jgi:hypothetical protein
LRIHDVKSFFAPRPRYYTDPIARFPRRRPIMAFDSADALAKTYARNKKLLSLRSITNGLQQTGLLVAYTYRASVHLDPPLSAQRSAWPRR